MEELPITVRCTTGNVRDYVDYAYGISARFMFEVYAY
jgi:hypothetical protein